MDGAHAPDIINSELLVRRFGSWPSFYDAEIYSVHLDSGQRGSGRVRLTLEFHVFEIDAEADADSRFRNHTLVVLEFEDITDLALDSFGPQSVILSAVAIEPGEHSVDHPTRRPN